MTGLEDLKNVWINREDFADRTQSFVTWMKAWIACYPASLLLSAMQTCDKWSTSAKG